jgi:hypothetical protein
VQKRAKGGGGDLFIGNGMLSRDLVREVYAGGQEMEADKLNKSEENILKILIKLRAEAKVVSVEVRTMPAWSSFYTCTHTHIHTDILTYVHCTQSIECIHTYIHTYILTCVHCTQSIECIHTYVHTYIQIDTLCRILRILREKIHRILVRKTELLAY